MIHSRHLEWDGCFNVRDLGGLPTADGRVTRRGAVVRADSVNRLTEPGWAALEAHGINTVIDLRNDFELDDDASPRPPGIETLHLPLDGLEDSEFWERWEAEPPPLYYRPHLERLPERSVAALRAIAHAPTGGVLVHCVGGIDRTGLVAMVLLALAGVSDDDIAADHALSDERIDPLYAALALPDRAEVRDALTRRGTSGRDLIVSTLQSLDIEAVLRKGGLLDDDLSALHARFLEPGAHSYTTTSGSGFRAFTSRGLISPVSSR